MKKRHIYFLVIAVSSIICADALINPGMTNVGGAPVGKTGSPGDGGATCNESGCHNTFSVVAATGLITSDVPASGYVPGTVYTLTCNCTGGSSNVFGFEICSEDSNHAKKGTLAPVPGATTHLVGANKYITHTSSGVTGSGNAKSWTIKWTAPAAGTGKITFYGAFNFANGNGNSAGDQIKTSSLEVTEHINTAVIDPSVSVSGLSIYPNPVKDIFSVKYSLEKESKVEISMYDITGKNVKNFVSEMRSPGTHEESFNTENMTGTGIYFLVVNANGKSDLRRIVVQK